MLEMPAATPLQPRYNHSVMPGVHSVIPMRNQGKQVEKNSNDYIALVK